MKTQKLISLIILTAVGLLYSCKDEEMTPTPLDPDTATHASVDRFSADAGTLFVRDGSNGLPDADAPINFDQAPFITKGLGPNGEVVQYYNFDVQPLEAAPIYVLFREGEMAPVDGQLNIIDVLPGDEGYNDFWQIHKVTVPANYVANTVTSKSEIDEMGYAIENTSMVVNCPVVPEGSTANLRYNAEESNDLHKGWYQDKVVLYFTFSEKELSVSTSENAVLPLSDILVSFNINPNEAGGGPPSGFKTEMDTNQTHNVTESLPDDSDYSPLWDVDVYDNADFDMVMDYTTAQNANVLATGVAIVNCPIISVN